MTILVDQRYQAQNGTATVSVVNLASNLYLGGIPPNSEASRIAYESRITLTREFGGCMKDLRINNRYLRCPSVAFTVNMGNRH